LGYDVRFFNVTAIGMEGGYNRLPEILGVSQYSAKSDIVMD
jgi:hypothetical protein